MRTTKTVLFAAAALAAGLVASSAQVYSQNVVGYVNKIYTNGLVYMMGNPLQNTNDTLQTILPNPPSGTAIYIFDANQNDFTGNYTFQGAAWDVPTATIPAGMGVFLYAAADFTNTYVGNVLQGSLTNTNIVGNGTVSAISSMVPVAGVTNVMVGYVGADGDSVYTWDAGTGDIAGNSTLQGGQWSPDNLEIPVGDAFLFFRQGVYAPWVRTFTVQ